MKYIKSFLVLAIAILGFSSVDAQAQSYVKAAGDAPVSAIEKKVFKEIIKLPYYGVFDRIAYKVDGDTVTLFGKVVKPITRRQAEDRVEEIAGVRRVVNNIEVLPLSSFDDRIRVETLRSFSDKGLYRYLWEPNPSVRIIVANGHVELEGFVANRGDYNLMNILARGVFGTFSVKNNLVVESDRNR
jgi:hyperosmotically inducible protein